MKDRPHILIVEDEPKLAQLLADYLQADGYACTVVRDGHGAIPALREHEPVLMVLDLMLPGRDGLSICRELRSFSTVPVIHGHSAHQRGRSPARAGQRRRRLHLQAIQRARSWRARGRCCAGCAGTRP